MIESDRQRRPQTSFWWRVARREAAAYPTRESMANIGEKTKADCWGLAFAGALGVLIVAGSRNLDHFDAALVGYTFATLFATFGITYRYAMWLQRAPTPMYMRRGAPG